MAHRTFKDSGGRDWEVWDVVPSQWVGPTLDGGWLAFQSGEDRRRLAPLPIGISILGSGDASATAKVVTF